MRIGIALGGGGAKGFAHIGVLEALSEAGIDCDAVSGTSIGALVGAAYAADRLSALKDKANSLSVTDIPRLLSPTWSKQGFFSGRNTLELLGEVIGIDLIEDLPKRFAAAASDLHSGTLEIFTKGDLRQAVRASIAIPLVFTPVSLGEKILVDGGLIEPIPIEAARKLETEFVIAVDLFGHLPNPAAFEEQEESGALNYLRRLSHNWLYPAKGNEANLSLLDVIERTLTVSQQQLTKARLRDYPPDILISPDVSHLGALDFHKGMPLIEVGRAAAEEMLPQIKNAISEKLS